MHNKNKCYTQTKVAGRPCRSKILTSTLTIGAIVNKGTKYSYIKQLVEQFQIFLNEKQTLY